MSKKVDRTQEESFEQESELDSPAYARLAARRAVQRLLTWDRPPSIRASRLRPRADARGTTTPASLRKAQSEANVLGWYYDRELPATPATPNTTPVNPFDFFNLPERPASAPPPYDQSLDESDVTRDYQFQATLTLADTTVEDIFEEQVVNSELFSTTVNMPQIFPLDDIDQSERVNFRLTDAEGKVKERVLRAKPSEIEDIKGYLELRERQAKELIAQRNQIKQLAKKTEFKPFEREELKNLLKSAKQLLDQVKGYEATLTAKIEIESLEDFQELVNLQISPIVTALDLGAVKLRKLAQEDLQEDDEDGSADADQLNKSTRAETRRADVTSLSLNDDSTNLVEALTRAQKTKVTSEELKQVAWDGSPTNFQRYKKDSEELFGQYSSISYFKKFTYMKATLPAQHHVHLKRYETNKEGYEDLWRFLSRMFGRSKDLIRLHEQELQNLPVLYKGKNNLLDDQKFADHISRANIALTNLNKLGETGKSHHARYIPWMVSRIDSDLATPFLATYEESLDTWLDKNINPVDKYIAYLERCQLANHDQLAYKKARSEIARPNHSNGHNSRGNGRGRGRGSGNGRGHGRGNGRGGYNGYGTPIVQTYATQSQPIQSVALPACLFCSKTNHTSNQCRNKGDPATGFPKCYQQRACVVCLETGHNSRLCPKRKTCNVKDKGTNVPCDRFHNPALHGMKFIPYKVWLKDQQQQRAAQGGAGQGRPPGRPPQ